MIVNRAQEAALTQARVFWPRFAYFDGANEFHKTVTLFTRATKYTAVIISGMVLAIFILAQPFLVLWIGEGFEPIYPLVIILSCGFLVRTSNSVARTLMNARGEQRTVM